MHTAQEEDARRPLDGQDQGLCRRRVSIRRQFGDKSVTIFSRARRRSLRFCEMPGVWGFGFSRPRPRPLRDAPDAGKTLDTPFRSHPPSSELLLVRP